MLLDDQKPNTAEQNIQIKENLRMQLENVL